MNWDLCPNPLIGPDFPDTLKTQLKTPKVKKTTRTTGLMIFTYLWLLTDNDLAYLCVCLIFVIIILLEWREKREGCFNSKIYTGCTSSASHSGAWTAHSPLNTDHTQLELKRHSNAVKDTTRRSIMHIAMERYIQHSQWSRASQWWNNCIFWLAPCWFFMA